MSTQPHASVISSLTSASPSTLSTTSSSSSSSSLASDYAILIRSPNGNELIWELYSLNRWEDPNDALRQLSEPQYSCTRDEAISPLLALSCQWSQSDSPCDLNNNGSATVWSIKVLANDAVGEVDATTVPLELLCILSRIMVQSASTQIVKLAEERKDTTLLRITLHLFDGSRVCQQILLSNLCGNGDAGGLAGVSQLFAPLNSQYADMELVDMVNEKGVVLGALPRPYIHAWNILHRGSGILVTKDTDVIQVVKEGKDQLPPLYVHQRTSSKRIFPSLFDMFVGGLSCHGEDSQLTAAREVAEELGLTRSLDTIMLKNKQRQQHVDDKEEKDKLNNPLSEKLFQCTVCTSYNRCVVSVYTYTTCDEDRITWQEEEVVWGDYVPYAIVEQAAASSINRLVESGVWPESERIILDDTKCSIDNEQLIVNTELASGHYAPNAWDFVPDGLLIWKAWNSFLSGCVSNTSSSR